MTDFLIYLSFSEAFIGAIMIFIAWFDPKWLRAKSETYHNILTLVALILVLASGHNLIGLGIWGIMLM